MNKSKILLGLSVVCLLVSVSCEKNQPDRSPVSTNSINDKPSDTKKLTQRLIINVPNMMMVNSSVSATVTSSEGQVAGAISCSIQNGTGSAMVSSDKTITATKIGTVTLTVSSAGDARYYAATASKVITIVARRDGRSSQPITGELVQPLITGVKKQKQTLEVIAVPKWVKVDQTEGIEVRSSHPSAKITYSIIGGAEFATINENTGKISGRKGPGKVTVKAMAAGDDQHEEAFVTQDVTIVMDLSKATTGFDVINNGFLGQWFNGDDPNIRLNGSPLVGVGGYVVIVEKTGSTDNIVHSFFTTSDLSNLTAVGDVAKIKLLTTYKMAVFAIKSGETISFTNMRINEFINAHADKVIAVFYRYR